MPLYDYECQNCKHIQEELHSMSGPTYTIICKKCKSEYMKKCMSRPGMFLFAHKVPKEPNPMQSYEDD
jgi:putative FmdB family regulatory protein